MGFLTTFGLVLGFVLMVIVMVAFIALPGWWLADKADDRWGYGAGLATILGWTSFAGSLLFTIIVYVFGGIE